jgi:hypothetical protein
MGYTIDTCSLVLTVYELFASLSKTKPYAGNSSLQPGVLEPRGFRETRSFPRNARFYVTISRTRGQSAGKTRYPPRGYRESPETLRLAGSTQNNILWQIYMHNG